MTLVSWDTSMLDWEERLLSGRSLVPDLPLFEAEADRAERIFKRLRLPDVPGMPTMAEAVGEWYLPIVRALFGSLDPTANVRRIQEFFQLIPKKNAKSSNGAAVMVTALIMNRRPSGEFLFIAPTKEIADIAFKQAEGTIRADPELEKLFHIQRHIRLITHLRTRALLQIKAADTDVITGGKALGTMIDETHVFAARARAADVFVELRGALASRQDGFLFQTTTQSKAPPAGVFLSELRTARDVRDGRLRLPVLPILYELPDRIARDGGWKNERFWHLVNPNLGRSVSLDFLRRELLRAEERGMAEQVLLASQHFNVEIGVSLLADRWAGAEHWAGAADPGLTLETLLDRSEVVVCGIDGGGLDDLFGFAVLGRESGEVEITAEVDGQVRVFRTKRWLCWSHAWCHRSVLSRRPSIAARLGDFAGAGELTIVDTPLADSGAIVGHIKTIKERGLLGGVAVDPAGLGEFVDALDAIDINQENKLLIGIAQGIRLMNAIKTVERRVVNGTFVHAVSSLMDWCVGNVRIEPLATAIRATKAQAGEAKIDPWMAMMNAAEFMATNPGAAGRSVYEDDLDALEGAEAGPGRSALTDPGIARILQDRTHPEFEAARRLYEEALLLRDEEGWS